MLNESAYRDGSLGQTQQLNESAYRDGVFGGIGGTLRKSPPSSTRRDGILGELNERAFQDGVLGELNERAFRDGVLGQEGGPPAVEEAAPVEETVLIEEAAPVTGQLSVGAMTAGVVGLIGLAWWLGKKK